MENVNYDEILNLRKNDKFTQWINNAEVNKTTAMKEEILKNVEESRIAREASGYKNFIEFESGLTKTSYVKSIDFSKLGTGKIGDFTNLKGSNINEVLSWIPKDATKRELRPIAGKVSEGFEYKWVQDGKTWRVRVHGPDASAPLGTNASEGWVVRIQQGKKYMDSNGVFHSDGISNPNSPYFNEELINDTHIPITIK